MMNDGEKWWFVELSSAVLYTQCTTINWKAASAYPGKPLGIQKLLDPGPASMYYSTLFLLLYMNQI